MKPVTGVMMSVIILSGVCYKPERLIGISLFGGTISA